MSTNVLPTRTDSFLKRRAPTFGSLIKHRLGRPDRRGASSGGKHDGTHDSDPHPPVRRAPSPRRPPRASHDASRRDHTVDAPPPYTAAPTAAPTARAAAAADDDPYAFLRSFDTVFLIDDSGSMAGSRWRETGRALATIAPICTQHDADGIDIFFLNAPDAPPHHHITSAGAVRAVFDTVRPRGGTPTGQRLDQILRPYLRRYQARPDAVKALNVICITDGAPSDDVESALIRAAKKLDRLDAPAWQVGVQFFQVGRDEHAARHLQQLDDGLAHIAGDGDLRDMVDTVPFRGPEGTFLSADGILKVVLGAVNRRLDRATTTHLRRP